MSSKGNLNLDLNLNELLTLLTLIENLILQLFEIDAILVTVARL